MTIAENATKWASRPFSGLVSPRIARKVFYTAWSLPLALAALIAIPALNLHYLRFSEHSVEAQKMRNHMPPAAPQQRVIRIISNQSGRLAEIRVSPGDQVVRGQLLAKLDTSVLVAESVAAYAQIRYLEMQLSLVNSEAYLQNILHADKPLALFSASGALPQASGLHISSSASGELVDTWQQAAPLAQAKIDTIVAALKASRASLSYIRDQIENCTIFSPVNGKIILGIADAGQYLESGHGVLMVRDDGQ